LLDWQTTHRRRPVTRNAAIRDASHDWLDQHEQLAGLVASQVLQQQFQAAYDSLRPLPDGVPIYQLRRLLRWPLERFDAVLEALRAAHAVDLEALTEPAATDPTLLSGENIQTSLFTEIYTPPFPSLFCLWMTSP